LDYLTIDIETTGLKHYKDKRFLIGYAWGSDVNNIKTHREEKISPKFRDMLLDPDLPKIAFNAPFDLTFLTHEEINITNIEDVYLMAKLIEENRNCGLKPLLAAEYGSSFVTEEQKIKAWLKEHKTNDYSLVPSELMDPYLDKDVVGTHLLFLKYKDIIQEHYAEAYSVDKTLIPIIVEMQKNGIGLNPNKIAEFRDYLEIKIEHMGERLRKLTKELNFAEYQTINFGSNQQVGKLLNFLGYPLPIASRSGDFMVSEPVLSELEGIIPELILKRREHLKMLKTFGENLLEFTNKDTLFFNLRISGCRTGRFSSSSPNMQNLPIRGSFEGRVREFFEPRPGYIFASFDYSQMEPRLLARYTKGAMLDAFRQGRDIHEETAKLALGRQTLKPGERFIGKQINLAISYGMGIKALASLLGVEYGRARQLLYTYKANFPAIETFNQSASKRIMSRGYVKTLLGRRRRLATKDAYKAVNAIIQGGAGELLKIGMIRSAEVLKGAKSRMLLSIHDEILFEIAVDELDIIPKLKEAMEIKDFNDLELKVDIEIFIESWGAKKDAVKWTNDGTWKESVIERIIT